MVHHLFEKRGICLKMGFVEAVRTCFSKYFTFSGRAARPEYWWFVLFVVGISIVLSFVDALIFGVDPETDEPSSVLTGLFQLAIFIPGLAVGWRRLHDSGRPGWYLLLPMLASLAFVISMFFGVFAFGVAETELANPDNLIAPAALLGGAGFLVFLVVQLVLLVLMIWWMTRPSDPGPNEYGPQPA